MGTLSEAVPAVGRERATLLGTSKVRFAGCDQTKLVGKLARLNASRIALNRWPRSGASRKRFLRSAAGPLGAICVVAVAMRFVTIGQQSYWLDETDTVSVLHGSFTRMLSGVARHESTPPLYYILAWVWSHIFGHTEAALRSLSASAGVATVVVVYLVGREVAGRRVGLLAAALAAVNPFLIWYSQEARAYALLALFSVLSLYFLTILRGDRQDERRNVWLWALTAGLALCTHYFAIFVVAPEIGWLLWARRRRAVPPVVFVGAVGLALLPLIHAQSSTRHTAWISATPLTSRVALVPEQFVAGPDSPGWRLLTIAALLAVLVAGVGLLAHSRESKRRVRLPLLVVCAGAVMMLALALVGDDVLLSRNAIELLPIACVPVACGLAQVADGHRRQRVRLVGALAVVTILGTGSIAVIGVDLDQRFQRTDWRDAAHVIRQSRVNHLLIVDPWGASSPLIPFVGFRQLRREQTLRTHEIDVLHYFRSPTGAVRSAIAVRVPRGFHRVSVFRAPALEVTRYVTQGTRSVVTPDNANALIVP